MTNYMVLGSEWELRQIGTVSANRLVNILYSQFCFAGKREANIAKQGKGANDHLMPRSNWI